MPKDEMLDIAIMWLQANEGADGESDACAAVADWINHEMRERYLRTEARRAGVPVARLRRKLAENAGND